tara:strand:- start:875 stop:1231 length:357 start_codon:yes stop_codon:yes gene_type:complete
MYSLTKSNEMTLQRTGNGFGSTRKSISEIYSKYDNIDEIDEIENNINNVIKNLNIYKCEYKISNNNCNCCNSKDNKIDRLETELKKYCVYCDEWIPKDKIEEHNNSEECENNFYDCYN